MSTSNLSTRRVKISIGVWNISIKYIKDYFWKYWLWREKDIVLLNKCNLSYQMTFLNDIWIYRIVLLNT